MTQTIDRQDIMAATAKLCGVLNDVEKRTHAAKGYIHSPDFWHIKERSKFDALDCGDSGAFLVEKATGELFNISGYGRPDYNKKRKADLGNVLTVDAEALHARRWNYLR
jgi:hypothetical protein